MTMDLTVIPFDWVTTFAVLGLIVLLVYLYGTWTFSTWSQLGIPGPTPEPYFGNARELGKKGLFTMALAWSKQYGKYFGMYMMREPVVLTTDVDILKEVFIKDFNNFTDRPFANPLTPYPLYLSLFFAFGEQWRRQRHTMTPTFSSSKLKMMGPFITQCCQNLVQALEKSTDAEKLLDVKQTFGAFTLDIIAGTGFGFQTNSLKDDDSVFLDNAKAVIGGANRFKLSVVIAAAFPSLGHVMRRMGFSINPLKELRFITQTINAVIQERKHENKTTPVWESGGRQVPPYTHQDLTQLMLDAEASNSEVAGDPSKKHLTRDEIIGQGLLFFIAGFETTATTLQYLSYLLALHPDKQEKLYDEIVTAIGDADPAYENVMNIPYLDSCIREALRIFPPVALMARKAAEERTIKGVTIPAGVGVGVNIIGLMRDEEFFPEPDKFIPERFEDDQNPIPQLVKEMAFGAGPRQCIAMRLAMYEAKMAVASIVRKFRFVKAKETPEEITLRPQGLSCPDKPIFIATQRR